MATTATEQFNNNYIRTPRNATLSRLSFGIVRVISEIFSFTGKAKGGKELSCHRTYNKFKERCGVSRATVGRALKIGRSEGLIKGNNKQGFTCEIEAENGEFYRLPSWAYQEQFEDRKGKFRKLFNSELKLYALFYTRCTAKKNGKHTYEATIADLAKETGLSERTVQRAVWALIRAELVYRPKKDKGINAYKVSRYTLNYKLVLLKEKTANERRKEVEKELAKIEDEPFPEFTSTDEVGTEKFILHTQKPHLNSNRGFKQRKDKHKFDIPEKEFFKVGVDELYLPNYVFSSASDEELKNLYKLYSPCWQKLSNMSQYFLSLIQIELEKRQGILPP